MTMAARSGRTVCRDLGGLGILDRNPTYQELLAVIGRFE